MLKPWAKPSRTPCGPATCEFFHYGRRRHLHDRLPESVSAAGCRIKQVGTGMFTEV
ncbi:hypothetical protein OG937_01325 [Streptomyces sp. NBC_00510]